MICQHESDAPSTDPPAPRRRCLRVVSIVLSVLGLALIATALWRVAAPIDSTEVRQSHEMAMLLDTEQSLRSDIAREVRSAKERADTIASDPEIVEALRAFNVEAAQRLCNLAMTGATEIDAVALFSPNGKMLAINSVYPSGDPIEPARVERIIAMDIRDRNFIQGNIQHGSREPVLEFHTACDITSAFFDSTDLSIAYSMPVVDPIVDQPLGVVSVRMRFDHLRRLIDARQIAALDGLIEFVVDDGTYFSEAIRAGAAPAPVPTTTLNDIAQPLTREGSSFTLARHEDQYLCVFRLDEFTTPDGRGIQVMIAAPAGWLERSVRRANILHAVGLLAIGLLLSATAGLVRLLDVARRNEWQALDARNRSERALAELGTCRAALDSHFIVIITDADGTIVDANNAFYSISKLPRDRIIGQKRQSFDSGWHAAAFFRTLVKTISAGKTWRGEICNRAGDGSLFWLETTIVPFKDASGTITRFIELGTDTTERKAAEKMLSDERAQLIAFVAHAPAAIAMLDRNMCYVEASDRWIADFGLAGKSLSGISQWELFPEMPAHWKEAYLRGLAGEVVRQEHDVWRPPGQNIDQHLRWEVRPWYVPGTGEGDSRKVGGIMILAENLATTLALQERAAETAQRLEMALDAGGLGSWDWDVTTGHVYFDDRFARQLGLTPDELGPHADEWLRRLHPDDAPVAQRAVHEHLAGKTPFYENEHRVRHADGTWRWILDRGKVVERGPDNEPLRMVGTHSDITERKAAEAQLGQASKLVSIGQLAAGIAHEINTPAQYVGDNARFLQENFGRLLEVIRSYRALLSTESQARPWSERNAEMERLSCELDVAFLEEEVPKAIEQSIEGLNRISSIITAMKEFSHPGSACCEPADINSAITSTVTVCRNRWKYVADVELNLDPARPHVPLMLDEFNQVILNLVVNASDAIAEAQARGSRRHGKIKVTTRTKGGHAVIEVSDNGTGIPDSIRERIFDPFFTTKSVGKGTGQGLSIAHATIVEKHHGRISFATSPEHGTTFVVHLPLEHVETAHDQEEQVAA